MTARAHRDEWLWPTLERLLPREELEVVRATGDMLWQAAVEKGFTTDDSIVAGLATRFRMPVANLAEATAAARDTVNEALARKYMVLPLRVTDSVLEIATANPNDLDCERALGFATGKSVRILLASPSAIAVRLDEVYQPEQVVDRMLEAVGEAEVQMLSDAGDTSSDFDLGADKAAARPIIKLVDHIITEGIALRASDIHLEVQEGAVQVTYRIDGVLRPNTTLPRAVGTPLVSRIKIMSGLDIADRLRPQDGRARVSINGKRVDLRVSTLPASTGEKVVIRILDTTANVLQIDTLGVEAEDLERLQQLMNLREGIILVTGPTGSGKTTTLYAALKTIHQRGVNIVTVEDPVEYKLNGIVQVQVNDKAGLTFSTALRSILRQDPDVVLVGEIRDRETASIAIQASLTGHLVLSTLHTIDAASSVARLLDIGIESYKIGAALKGIVAQRLVRRLCPSCKQVADAPIPSRLQQWFPPGTAMFKAVGCAECGGTGYHGRLALMEVLVTTPEVERRISAGESAERIAEAGRLGGMRSLWAAGVDHIMGGLTDLDELLRVVEVPVPRTESPVRTRPSALTPAPVPAVRSGMGSGRHYSIVDSRAAAPRASTSLAGDAFELVDDLLPAVGQPSLPRVLLVEDEAPLRTVLRDLLEADGFHVIEAVDGVSALEEVDLSTPDVMVLDLNLPRLDGFGVLKKLRARPQTSKLPVIVLTAVADEDNEVKVFECGANDFLSKPFRPRALSARLKAIVRRVEAGVRG